MALKQHSFLGNGRETDNGTTSVARQQILNKLEQTAVATERLGKHVPAATDTHATEERRCLRGSCRGVIKKTTGATKSVLHGSVKKRVNCSLDAVESHVVETEKTSCVPWVQ
jgi:hypothetical protein